MVGKMRAKFHDHRAIITAAVINQSRSKIFFKKTSGSKDPTLFESSDIYVGLAPLTPGSGLMTAPLCMAVTDIDISTMASVEPSSWPHGDCIGCSCDGGVGNILDSSAAAKILTPPPPPPLMALADPFAPVAGSQ